MRRGKQGLLDGVEKLVGVRAIHEEPTNTATELVAVKLAGLLLLNGLGKLVGQFMDALHLLGRAVFAGQLQEYLDAMFWHNVVCGCVEFAEA